MVEDELLSMTVPKPHEHYQDAPESYFLVKLFDMLRDRGLHYAVMRNHEPLPYGVSGSDLDILVAAESAQRFRKALLSSIHSAGGVPIGVAESIGFFKLYVFGRRPEGDSPWWGVRIDVNVGIHYKGHSLLIDSDSWPTQAYRGISVLSEGFAGVLGVLKEVLNNGAYPARYGKAARQGVETDWTDIKAQLAPMGSKALQHFRELVLSENTAGNRGTACRVIRDLVVRHAMWPHSGMFLWERMGFERSKLLRYLKPSGKVVVFLGTDGAGKTTVINAIKPVLDDATHNATIVHHLRPNLLPPLARLKRKNTSGVLDGKQNIGPHDATSSGFSGSFLRLLYLIFDYVFGYWLKTRLEIAKQPTVIIFDRYAYDIELDPRRFRINLPAEIIRWFTRFVPNPDLIVCLYGEPETISIRKEELPVLEVKRQTEALLEFARREPRAVMVSTHGTIEQTRDLVLAELQKCCAKKDIESAE